MASLFSTSAGLVLASEKGAGIDEATVAAMGSLLSDTASKVSEELALKSEMESIKVLFKEHFIICRNIEIEKTLFILAVLAPVPDSDEIEKYYDQLLDWAEENSLPELKKLATI
jgi:predicted regulator of Ras-like GTPase activity (Roadblock/LC7/MglB family)